VFVLAWFCFASHDLERVRHDFIYVLDDRLLCGQRVRGWVITACHL
jgi:hypothetical protein